MYVCITKWYRLWGSLGSFSTWPKAHSLFCPSHYYWSEYCCWYKPQILNLFFKPLCFYVWMYVCRFQNVVLRCPTPRLHRFLSSHLPSFRFLLSMTFPIPSIQFFFGLPRALSCFGIHCNVILGNLPSAILKQNNFAYPPIIHRFGYKFYP